jgi:hypothetical protein
MAQPPYSDIVASCLDFGIPFWDTKEKCLKDLETHLQNLPFDDLGKAHLKETQEVYFCIVEYHILKGRAPTYSEIERAVNRRGKLKYHVTAEDLYEEFQYLKRKNLIRLVKEKVDIEEKVDGIPHRKTKREPFAKLTDATSLQEIWSGIYKEIYAQYASLSYFNIAIDQYGDQGGALPKKSAKYDFRSDIEFVYHFLYAIKHTKKKIHIVAECFRSFSDYPVVRETMEKAIKGNRKVEVTVILSDRADLLNPGIIEKLSKIGAKVRITKEPISDRTALMDDHMGVVNVRDFVSEDRTVQRRGHVFENDRDEYNWHWSSRIAPLLASSEPFTDT